MKIKAEKAFQPQATNLAGGIAFKIKNPARRLVAMVGSSFFNEPQYYNQDTEYDPKKSRGSETEAYKSLNGNAKDIIATAIDVANSSHPSDLLAIAAWARTELNIRTTPQILLAVAAHEVPTKPFVSGYASRIIQRPDEIKDVFSAYLALFGRPLPWCLKTTLAAALSTLDERLILKYNSARHPSFTDVLRMVERRTNYPFTREVFEFVVNDRIINSEKTPVFFAHKALMGLKDFDKVAEKWASKARATWEVLLSKFGNSARKKDLWKYLIKTEKLGYMALLRNLRNIEEAGVSREHLLGAAEKIADPVQVRASKQLPFRFVAAHEQVETREFKNAVSAAADIAADNCPELPGVTAILVDESESMDTPLSGLSKMSRRQAANTLAAILVKRSPGCVVVPFGDIAQVLSLKYIPVERRTIPGIVSELDGTQDIVGCATNAHLAIDSVPPHVSRIILLSDMQCWDSGESDESVSMAMKYYWKYSPETILHSINMADYKTSVVSAEDKRVNLVSGFSEKILDVVAAFEGPRGTDGCTSLEYIREKYPTHGAKFRRESR